MQYLIVVETEAADQASYHTQPYRIAASLDEAGELMRDYMAKHAEELTPIYFVLYPEIQARFGDATYIDPALFESVDATEWLQRTGRI